MFVIEKDVPVPHSAVFPKYPFAEMEVGDSFLITKEERGSIYGSGTYWSMKYRSCKVKFRTAIQPNGMVRVWRVA